MLSALHLAGDVAASMTISDRTEMRVRDPGDVPAGPSLDIATTPEARLVLASPRTTFTLAYTPRLTLWDVNDVGAHPLWLHAGTARLEQKEGASQLWLEQDASYGATNFAALTLAPTPDGVPPRVDVIPSSQIVQVESSATTLGSRTEGRRWAFHSTVGYQFSGGADDASRLIVPFQRGPLAEVGVTLSTSPLDRLATTVTGADSTFSSGPQIVIGEADQAWKRPWSSSTETEFTLGISEARVQASALAQSYGETDPVAEAVLEQRILTDEDRVTVRVGARLGPVVNRLLGIVDERVQGSLLSQWNHGRLAIHAFAGAQQSVHVGGPDATELLTGEIGLSYTATDAVAFDVGVRGLLQKATQPVVSTTAPGVTDIVEASLVQGVIFVGVTLRAPTIRM